MSANLPSLFDRARPHPIGFRDVAHREVAEASKRERIRIVDVRDSFEFAGGLGHVPGAELVPLATLGIACATWNRDEPIVLVCRSGQRSARAAVQLARMGFTRVMNMTGGMIAWSDGGLPTERGN